MADRPTFVIVGASLAGARAAATLREEGFEGRILLVGEEPVRPYERPPLSKAYLRGEADFEVAAVHEADYYERQGIELLLSTTVTALDLATSQVTLSSGERVAYDRALLTTGAVPRRLSVPGADLPGVRYLRTLADSDTLREAIGRGVPVVVIGAGWIGAEVTASARQLGADVTMLDLGSVPLERVLGARIGAVYRDLHIEHGVALRMGVGIESIGGSSAVEEVRLTDGTVLPAGLVVAGIGVLPRTELAETAGLDVDNGVLTDENLRTSADNVFAAGDVANAFHPSYGRRIRLEHWSSALNQGPVAARNMLGDTVAYDKVPYFYSDQYDFSMEYRGFAPDADEVVLRGDVEQRQFVAFWLAGDSVVAAMNANVWDQTEAIETLLGAGGPVDPPRLIDADVDLLDYAEELRG